MSCRTRSQRSTLARESPQDVRPLPLRQLHPVPLQPPVQPIPGGEELLPAHELLDVEVPGQLFERSLVSPNGFDQAIVLLALRRQRRPKRLIIDGDEDHLGDEFLDRLRARCSSG